MNRYSNAMSYLWECKKLAVFSQFSFCCFFFSPVPALAILVKTLTQTVDGVEILRHARRQHNVQGRSKFCLFANRWCQQTLSRRCLSYKPCNYKETTSRVHFHYSRVSRIWNWADPRVLEDQLNFRSVKLEVVEMKAWSHLFVLSVTCLACIEHRVFLLGDTTIYLRGAWSDGDTNDIFAHCSLIFYYLDFKFSNFVCPSELHPLICFFF